MREQLLCYALRYEGDWKKMKLALDRQEPWTRMAYEGSYVTIADQAYPDKLRRLACPPWILFYEGDMTLLQKRGGTGVSAGECCGAKKLCAYYRLYEGALRHRVRSC